MSTSLAQQLRLLAIPQSLQQTEVNKKASLLFDAKEAAKIDRRTIYDIGVDGLRELKILNPAFDKFSDNLFELSAVSLERTVEAKEINAKLNKLIKKFLCLLSPYLLLKPAHKALEWLICRFLIHEFNIEDLMGLIIPYHETNIFVKILQLVDLRQPNCNHWAWLTEVRKQGLHLPKSVLINHAISNSNFLRFICHTTLQTIKEHSKHNSEHKLGTLLTFYGTTLVNLLSRGPIDEQLLTVILPSFLASLSSKIGNFKAAGYMIGGQLVVANQISHLLLDEIVSTLVKDDSEALAKERALLLVLIFQSQNPSPEIPDDCIDKLTGLSKELAALVSEGVSIESVLVKVVKACLYHVIDVGEHSVDAQIIAWRMATEVNCNLVTCKKLVRCIDEYCIALEELLSLHSPKKERDPSLLKWMKELMGATLSRHFDVLEKSKDDMTFQKIREKWRSEDEIAIQEKAIAKLMKKCSGKNIESTWLHLRPLLLDKIENEQVFQALCKTAPPYDYLVMLLCLEKLLNAGRYSSRDQEALHKKIFKSRFGKTNSLLVEIKTKMEDGMNTTDVIETCIVQGAGEFELEFEPLNAALAELKKIDKIVDSSPLWDLSLKALAAALSAQFNPTHAMQLWKLLFLIKGKKGKDQIEIVRTVFHRKNSQIIDEILKSIVPLLKPDLEEKEWFDLTNNDPSVWIKVKILEYLLYSVHSGRTRKSAYEAALDAFASKCFYSPLEFIKFLSAVCCGNPFVTDPDLKISPVLRLYSFYTVWKQLSKKQEKAFNNVFRAELNKAICHLLVSLCDPSTAIRGAGLKVLKSLISILKTRGSDPATVFLDCLSSRSEELEVDGGQLTVALYCYLSPCETVQAILPKDSVLPLTQMRNEILDTITSDSIPLSIAASVLQALEGINSKEVIIKLMKLADRALDAQAGFEISDTILTSFWSRLNEDTAQVLEDKQVLELGKKCLKHSDSNPGVAFLKSVSKQVFEKLKDKEQHEILKLLIETRSETESSPIGSWIASAVKKINLDSKIIVSLIKEMTGPFVGPHKPKEPNPIVLSSIIIESKEWKTGISLLELVQSKKKLNNSHLILEPLFTVLKFCLDQEEQAAFEYSKQLVLGCLLYCCQKLSPENLILEESVLNVELVVQCLRASSNPQTHHHALMFLSRLAHLIPNQVMHNIMAIFTFMGSSLARLDDEYSVKILTQVVEIVIPVLVQSFAKQDVNNQVVMAEILRIFVWAHRDIPQHRRKPLFLQLVTTLGPERSLWRFLILLFENYVMRGDASKSEGSSVPKNLELGLEICVSMSPKTILESAVDVIEYLSKLPLEKMYSEASPTRKSQNVIDPVKDGLFDVDSHTPKQLRHFAFSALTFLNSLFADNNFIAQASGASQREPEIMESVFKEAIASIMKFIPAVNRQYEKLTNRYWKTMTHHCYDLLDKVVSLVSNEMLLNVISKLLNHSMGSLRRKALDLLNARLQNHRQDFTSFERNFLRNLIEPLLNIIKTIGVEKGQESEFIQQTALFSVRLIAKLLASEDARFFKEVLIELCAICKAQKCQGPLLGDVFLTVAELVACLKAHSVSELPVFMPLMLKIFSQKTRDKTADLGFTSVVMALQKIVDVLRHFLSPYLKTLLSTLCLASVTFKDHAESMKKLNNIKTKLANNVAYRVLIPGVTTCYDFLIEEEHYDAIGPLMTLLAESFSVSSEVLLFLPDLTQFFVTALEFRSQVGESISKNETLDVVDQTEGFIIEALVPLVLKLSESSFKPLYYQLFHWSLQHSDRSITFYRLSNRLAEKLKGLFVLFAGHFLQNAAQLLDGTNLSKTDICYYGNSAFGVQKSCLLLENILKTLHSVFLYDSTDSTNFLNKDKFEVLLHPLVDQLENILGGIESLEKRTETLLTPCLAQMALATDDILWKSLNYQILVKTKSSVPQVRIGALETIVAIATKLGEDYLMLLPETIGSLAELLEDDDERVESAIKKAIQKLEDVLGEPVREYFQ